MIDKFLNTITMYRLVLYGLMAIALYGFGLSLTGTLPSLHAGYMALTLITLFMVTYFANAILGSIFKVPLNAESSAITALIMFLILAPATNINDMLLVAVCAVIAMASKFVLNFRGKHIFNPAAFGVFILSTFIKPELVIWWAGSFAMLPIVLLIGLLIVRKIRHFDLFLSFVGIAVILIIANEMRFDSTVTVAFRTALGSWPVIFFGSIMLTEPLTTPPTKGLRIIYGVLVALLFGLPSEAVGPYRTPEAALLLGNIFSFAVSPKYKLILKLKEKLQLAPGIYDFVFTPNRPVTFTPGQYLEWTLGHDKSDGRGNRRYFTIASSPSEPELHLTIKAPETPSSFKKALIALEPGGTMLAGSLGGDFTLPKTAANKITAIAGGIGITPFRSMVKNFIDQDRQVHFTLFYAAANPQEFIYKDLFASAEKAGVKTVYVLSGAKEVPPDWQGETGYITKEMLAKNTPDYLERQYYLSGPNVMVEAYKKMLRAAGISLSAIHTDYFPGY